MARVDLEVDEGKNIDANINGKFELSRVFNFQQIVCGAVFLVLFTRMKLNKGLDVLFNWKTSRIQS